MFSVHFFISIPLPGKEWVLLADDLTIKKGGQRWKFLQEQETYINMSLLISACLITITIHKDKLRSCFEDLD